MLIFLGTAIRVSVFWKSPSLWEDEVFLSLNLTQRGYLDLLSPLDFCQSAPALFLWVEKASIGVFGVSERALRAPSLVAGLALLPLIWITARRLVGEWAALLALALVALSPNLVRYSNEVKPYGVDALVAVALVYFASAWRLRPSPLSVAAAAALGVAAVFLSNPAGFGLAALGLIWIRDCWKRRVSWQHWAALAVAGAAWAIAFGASYLMFRNAEQQTGSYITTFFQPVRLIRQAGFLTIANQVGHGFLSPLLGLDARIPLPVYGFAIALALTGVAEVAAIQSWESKMALFAPLLLVLAACAAGKWYFVVRVMLFASPLVAVLLAAGAYRAVGWFAAGVPRNLASVVACAGLLAFPAKATRFTALHPELMPMREAVAFATAQSQRGDTIYLYSKAVPAWMFYTTNWRSPDRDDLRWLTRSSLLTGPSAGNIGARGHRVNHEGWDLHLPYRDGWILVGEPEGIARSAVGPASNPPDPGWVDNEYGRVIGDSKGRAILVGLSVTERSYSKLIARFTSSGARTVAEYAAPGARVVVLDTTSIH